VPIVLKSGNLTFLEPSGPVQACNGIALLLPSAFNVHSLDIIDEEMNVNVYTQFDFQLLQDG
jgi:hypothetical protein